MLLAQHCLPLLLYLCTFSFLLSAHHSQDSATKNTQCCLAQSFLPFMRSALYLLVGTAVRFKSKLFQSRLPKAMKMVLCSLPPSPQSLILLKVTRTACHKYSGIYIFSFLQRALGFARCSLLQHQVLGRVSEMKSNMPTDSGPVPMLPCCMPQRRLHLHWPDNTV